MSRYIPNAINESLMQIRRRQLIEKKHSAAIAECKQAIRDELPGVIPRLTELGLTSKHAIELFKRLATEVAVEKSKLAKETK
jgi:hypothetical protein